VSLNRERGQLDSGWGGAMLRPVSYRPSQNEPIGAGAIVAALAAFTMALAAYFLN